MEFLAEATDFYGKSGDGWRSVAVLLLADAGLADRLRILVGFDLPGGYS